MRRNKLIAILLIFVLILTSCGVSQGDTSSAVTPASGYNAEERAQLISADNRQNGGGSYALDAYDAVIDEGSQVVLDALPFQNEIFCVITPALISEGYWLQQDGAEIYASPNYFYAAAISADGIWVLENNYSGGNSNYNLLLISQAGAVQKTISLSGVYPAESYERLLVCSGDKLYLVSGEHELVVIGADGSFICSIALPDEAAYPAVGNDGQIYIVQVSEGGNQLFLVDINSSALKKAFTCAGGDIFNGDNHNFLLLKNSSGLYSIAPGGETAPIVIWAECGISINRVFSIHALENGKFLLMCEDGVFVLSPVDSSDIQKKTTLKIATLRQSGILTKKVSDFNRSNSEYNVQIVDYSDSGNFEAETALTRLNTEILSGNYPDMLNFSSISPYPYISKSLLVNLEDLFKQDEEISIEDIVIRKALSSNDGIYFIGGTFNFETLVGRYSDFGDRYGWTLAEYLDFEKTLPDDVETIHNMTRDTLIDCIVSRYIRTAIDWDACTCSFNTPEFIALLEAGSRIRETPEDSANMSFGYGPAKVGNGTRLVSLSWIQTVWKLAYEEQMAGCKLSFIGWPTVDGRCGSDVHLIEPVGIINQGKNITGCREFVKFMLLHPDINSDSLPVYRPLLQDKVDAAKANENKDIPLDLSDSDIERFFSLVSEMDNLAIYDDTVLDIIRRESSSFFNGDKTAEEAAKIIQSKVSIYIAEQS